MNVPSRTMRWAPVAIGALILLVVAACTRAGPSGCASLPSGSIQEITDFTPAQQMRTGGVQLPLADFGLPTTANSADHLIRDGELDGLPLQLALTNGDALYRYFLDGPIPKTMTPEQFWAAGGVQFERDPAQSDDFAAFLLEELGERALPVEIGPYRGALTWADPTPSGVRTHNLYWSDAESSYALIAVRSPEAMVNLARGIVCR